MEVCSGVLSLQPLQLASSSVTLSPSRSTRSLHALLHVPWWCVVHEVLQTQYNQSSWVYRITMENEFGHLQASLSNLRLTTAFCCDHFTWCFVKGRMAHKIKNGKSRWITGSTSALRHWGLSQAVSDAVANVLLEHPVFVTWKAGVPHGMHLWSWVISKACPQLVVAPLAHQGGLAGCRYSLYAQLCPRAQLEYWTESENNYVIDLIKP